jgi:ParB/RepB/Spo0J family partition protein
MDILIKYAAYDIPLTDIYVDTTFNCRDAFTFASVQELAESIKAEGLNFPIAVQPNPCDTSQKYRLLAGHRRYAAVQMLKWQTIPAMVIPDLSEYEAKRYNLIENLERKNLNPLEEARALVALYPDTQPSLIAAGLKKSMTWVMWRLHLLELAPEVQKMVAAGRLRLQHADTLYKYPLAEQAARAHAILAERNVPRKWGKRSLARHDPRNVHLLIRQLTEKGITDLPLTVLLWCLGKATTEEVDRDIDKYLSIQETIRNVYDNTRINPRSKRKRSAKTASHRTEQANRQEDHC